MKTIMLICIWLILVGNLLTHRYLEQRIDMLQQWMELFHGVDFDKMAESVHNWKENGGE